MGKSKKKQSVEEDVQFLSQSYKSRDAFFREYKKIYYKKPRGKELYIRILTELVETITDDEIDRFKKLCCLLDYVSNTEETVTLKEYYGSPGNPIKNTNFVILACKNGRDRVLDYLLSSHCKVLVHLFFEENNPFMQALCTGKRELTLLLEQEDEYCHNAFYYAIRSCKVKLLNALINYYADNPIRLDETLSRAYEKLKIKNILLSTEMEIFVENKLVSLRFYSTDSEDKGANVKTSPSSIKRRIELVLESIALLKTEYVNTQVDERFLFILKFIAQNVHILKRLLKATYIRLPWEELEFSLIAFVSTFKKRQEINVFFLATLSKNKIIDHLVTFGKYLKDETMSNVNKLSDFPQHKRDQVVALIIKDKPEFEKLYQDYQEIRDVHSLEIMKKYIRLLSASDPNKKEGQLLIMRVLQVIGESLKNTLESPKLSSTTSELLLLSLPRNTREIVIGLRNSLSHAHSLYRRTLMEERENAKFFTGIQNDVKKIGGVIDNILFDIKVKTMKRILKNIADSDNLIELVDGFAGTLNAFELFQAIGDNSSSVQPRQLETLISELKDAVKDKSSIELELFNKINALVESEGVQSGKHLEDYAKGFAFLTALNAGVRDKVTDQNALRVIKFSANQTLKSFTTPPKNYSRYLRTISELSRDIAFSVVSRVTEHEDLKEMNKLSEERSNKEDVEKVKQLTLEIIYKAEFEADDVKWIASMKNRLNEKGFFGSQKVKKSGNLPVEKYKKLLTRKISELKNVMEKNTLGIDSENILKYLKNKKLQAALEMLVLDIMSILDGPLKYLENDLYFLDDYMPLLIGKCLRNHLAHYNPLVDLLLSHSSLGVIFNAKILSEEEIMQVRRKIGKMVKDNPDKLYYQFNESLFTIKCQNDMFRALEDGSLEEVKNTLKRGADLNGRSTNCATALHSAAKGSNIKVIEFLFEQGLRAEAKDFNGQTPLHVAASYGNANVVNCFLTTVDSHVNDVDLSSKTPLHIAAQNGHVETVKILLKNRADTVATDLLGFSPLHYATSNNHLDVFKVLLEYEKNVDVNEVMGGFTPLHISAERGHLQFVNFLISKKANVNAKTDHEATALHLAALNGHLEVVNVLLQNNATVDARAMTGCTPLHYAVENGHHEIAKVLLNYGANVNVFDKSYRNTPLHYAAKDGHLEIVKTLLSYKADARVSTVEGLTPLHFSAQSGHLEISMVLLKHGVNAQARDINNGTPLHHAIIKGHGEIAELLIKNKADVNTKDSNNISPLHMAAENGNKAICKFLLANKAAIDAKDTTGKTAVHMAAANGKVDVLELLILNHATVNAETNDGMTPLHSAAVCGEAEATALLLKHGADVNSRIRYSLTPLHLAIKGGHTEVVKLLLKSQAQVDDRRSELSALHLAVKEGQKEIVDILLVSGAQVNTNSIGETPLITAIRNNAKDIVVALIDNGATVNTKDSEPLLYAVYAGYHEIVKILLNSSADVKKKYSENATVLHLAAGKGHEEIVKTLIKNGADVNARALNDSTPLMVAAEIGCEEVIEILIENGANVNVVSCEGAPLHKAAALGYCRAVEILLEKGANVNLRDRKHRTPFELAVARGHLQVVKIMYKSVDLNAEGSSDFSLLHIASQGGNLEMVKFLVEKGTNIHAKNEFGSKPVHIAAREGHKDVVEFFLSQGIHIEEPGHVNQTLLHYAAMAGELEVVNYLIGLGINVNSQDINGLTPLHLAALLGRKDVVEVLVNNGAYYDAVDHLYRKAGYVARNEGISNILMFTELLTQAVKKKNLSDVEQCIEEGALVNGKNAEGATALHYAAWKGCNEILRHLLKHKANPSVIGSKGFSPLHYAAKFSNFEIVKSLLAYGAVYNKLSDSGKMPVDLTADQDIKNLLAIIGESFRKVAAGTAQVINDLNKIKDTETIKSIMNARNKENQTLVVSAMINGFLKIEELKSISQGNVTEQIAIATMLIDQGYFKKGLNILEDVYKMRKRLLGANNLATLDVQKQMAIATYKLGLLQEALNELQEVFRKQKEALGSEHRETLNTRSTVALLFHRIGKDNEAFEMYQEIYEKQRDLLGPEHSDTVQTQLHMALVLDRLGKLEEALDINRAVYENYKATSGANDPSAIRALNNVAMVLSHQEEYEEALKTYQEVYERKKLVLGVNHADTLRTLHNIAGVLCSQKKYHESLKAHQDVLQIQKKVLGPIHPDTINSEFNIGNLLFIQGKYRGAFKIYKECLERSQVVLGPSHPYIVGILAKMEVMKKLFKTQGYEETDILQYLQKDIRVNIAASNGDLEVLESLLKEGADVNDQDAEGRTPLHFAASGGILNVVNILLSNGADATVMTNKGNTPLHTATSKGHKEIVQALLKHIRIEKLNNFVNAKTFNTGSTSLHVAAKNGFLEIVRILLTHGAIFNIKNKECKTPADVSQDMNIINLLKFIGELFERFKNGEVGVINKLKKIKQNEFLAATNTRNKQGNTLLQVALANGHKAVASQLFEMIAKNFDNNK